jgi:L-fuculose-phosphate aldolase
MSPYQVTGARTRRPQGSELRKAEKTLREAIVAKARWMNASGLNQGTAGNISARFGDDILITPSAVAYEDMQPAMIASMPIDGEYGSWQGELPPSTEWRFHLDIMRARPEVGGIVHAHPTFATVLSMTRRSIPACHYMIAAFGGADIRCADYATQATRALSDNSVKALEGRNGCLLANHGMVAAGRDLDHAMWLAVELEAIAKHYYYSLLIGGPVILTDAAVEEVRKSIESYGLAAEPTTKARA